MIISRTPFRVSLFGGGTDYPAWYRVHGGAVLAAAIDKYCYLSCRPLPPFFEHRIRVVYSKIENCRTVGELQHAAVRAVLEHLRITGGLEIHHDGDLPARSGMGSSSAFTVGLLHALYAMQGVHPAPDRLAAEAIHLEQDVLLETVGSQDQVTVAHGGVNHVSFLPGGRIIVTPVAAGGPRLAELNAHLMLVYTGIQRTASQVAGTYAHDLARNAETLLHTRALVDEALAILRGSGPLAPIGPLMHDAWMAKTRLSAAVTTREVSGAYAAARAAGATGGKLTGAGGGGFLLLFVPPDRQRDVRAALSHLVHVPFSFDFSGSRIVLDDSPSRAEIPCVPICS